MILSTFNHKEIKLFLFQDEDYQELLNNLYAIFYNIDYKHHPDIPIATFKILGKMGHIPRVSQTKINVEKPEDFENDSFFLKFNYEGKFDCKINLAYGIKAANSIIQ